MHRPLRRPRPVSPLLASGLGALLSTWTGAAWAQQQPRVPTERADATETEAGPIIVTARRVAEDLQDVPIPISVVSGALIDDAGAFNVNRLKEIVPSVQFFSSNPRNSAINIRGLGAPFGLTNDGIEPGVGLYIDGVYFARPAAATLDFLDVEQIEVLRGPQGTLYGKNTTAGAINVTTRAPSFTPQTRFETSFGNLGFVQLKASTTGPLSDTVAARLSFSGTKRDGVLTDTRSGGKINDLDNLGVRGQMLFAPRDGFRATLSGDFTQQRADGYAQVFAGVAPTLRAANRQYAQIAADLNYRPPSTNPFDRLTDADTVHRSNQDLGGATLNLTWDIGPGALTSITAWRFWDWDPSNDRDFTGLPITTVSANPSKQRQWTQELRYAGSVTEDLSFVIGAFGFRQTIESTGNQSQGAAAARFLLAPLAASASPEQSARRAALIDGLTQTSTIAFENTSAAVFGQLSWQVTERLRLLPGIRFNYDDKSVDYSAVVSGGLATTDPAELALKRSVLAPQAYQSEVNDTNVSGQLTAAYAVSDDVNAYATYATSFKSIGLNLGGVPNDAQSQPVLSAAAVKPEDVRHIEIGLKTQFGRTLTLNLAAFDTQIDDYQATVVNAQVGVLRGYLANAERVRVRGVELDANASVGDRIRLYGAVAYTDAKYDSFPDAPAPLEGAGGPQAVDASGGDLPGVSEWAGSLGGEYVVPATIFRREGEAFLAVDASARTDFSSSPTPSRFLNIDGYALVNARLGFRAGPWEALLFARNLFDEDYFELLSAAPGGSGLYAGLPGDPRTYGVTLRGTF